MIRRITIIFSLANVSVTNKINPILLLNFSISNSATKNSCFNSITVIRIAVNLFICLSMFLGRVLLCSPSALIGFQVRWKRGKPFASVLKKNPSQVKRTNTIPLEQGLPEAGVHTENMGCPLFFFLHMRLFILFLRQYLFSFYLFIFQLQFTFNIILC